MVLQSNFFVLVCMKVKVPVCKADIISIAQITLKKQYDPETLFRRLLQLMERMDMHGLKLKKVRPIFQV